jgi:hypothetical protein
VEGLERYEQDWATEGLARQYLRNKRSYNYQKELLDVPEMYHYLKDNTSQRSDAPRGNTHNHKAAQVKKQAVVAKRAQLSKGKERPSTTATVMTRRSRRRRERVKNKVECRDLRIMAKKNVHKAFVK